MEAMAAVPLTRITAIAPTPGGVASATMVSSQPLIASFIHQDVLQIYHNPGVCRLIIDLTGF